jgi:serine protease AprX
LGGISVQSYKQIKDFIGELKFRMCSLILCLGFCPLLNFTTTVLANKNIQQIKTKVQVNRKIAPEIKILVNQYKQTGEKDKLQVVIKTKGPPADDLKHHLLSIDNSYHDPTTTNKIACELSIFKVDELAIRKDVISISLDERGSGKDNERIKALALMSQRLDSNLRTFLSVYKTRKESESVRVIIQTNEYSKSELDDVDNVKERFRALNAIAANIPIKDIKELASRDGISYISLDQNVYSTDRKLEATGISEVRKYSPILTGSGIGIAILDSGVDPDSLSKVFTNNGWKQSTNNRVVASVNFVSEEQTTADLNGHGTAVAAIAAGYNSDGYGGIAPGANIINVRVLNSKGAGLTSNVIKGIEWVIENRSKYNIRVINLSIGANSTTSFVNDPICQAVRAAVSAGIVVVVSAGNFGKNVSGHEVYGSISSPGTEPTAITVGAINTHNTEKRSDDVVINFSSRGPTRSYTISKNNQKVYDNLIKPDLVAPGYQIQVPIPPSSYLSTKDPKILIQSGLASVSGTSMAAPVVAGTVALLLSRNPTLSPSIIRAILQWTAQPIPSTSIYAQGAGYLNIDMAVRLAEAITPNAGTISVGAPLLVAPLPTPSKISDETIPNGAMVFLNGNHVFGGVTLFTEKQLPYDQGVIWYNDRLYKISPFELYQETTTVLTQKVKLLDKCINLNNTTLDIGSLECGTDLTQGITVTHGVTMSQGYDIGEGTILSEGIIITEKTIKATNYDED